MDGEFQEAKDQAVYLHEEQPHLFSFVVAYLYEEKYVPIKPSATVLGEVFGPVSSSITNIPLQFQNRTRARERRSRRTPTQVVRIYQPVVVAAVMIRKAGSSV